MTQGDDQSGQHGQLMPRPARYQALDGAGLPPETPLEPRFAAARSERLERAVARFAAARGVPAGAADAVPLVVDCAAASAPLPALDDDESYRLEVRAGSVTLAAPAEWGVLRGLATLTQLLGGAAAVAPCRIEDAPRYPWRGLMLDSARHFLPLEDLARTLDGMAAVKLNVLHLHLSDDQAFRFPSLAYPRLPGAPHYTRAELERLVALAADRGIRVVPELDVPGHTACWLQAYPEWGNRPARPSRKFGGHRECLDPTRPAVHEALRALFAELAQVFPDAYVHIGGDEVQSAWWHEDPEIRAYMERHGLADAAALQAHFNVALTEMLADLGKRTLGWDEVLHPTLPAGVTVQAWRGAGARDRALRAGFDCVLSAPYYLDLFFPADLHYRFDPGAPEQQLLAREDGLLQDPRLAHVAAGMAWSLQWRNQEPLETGAAQRGRLLGAEACLWSELVQAELLDVRLWSRLPAVAERFWSVAEVLREDDPELRARHHRVLAGLRRSAAIDVTADVRRLTAARGVPDAWWPLVEMLEPVKWYARLLGEDALTARLAGREMPEARPYDVDSPLDRVVDVLPPEGLGVPALLDLLRRIDGGEAPARAELAALAAAWQTLPDTAGPEDLRGPAVALAELGALLGGWLDGRLGAGVLTDDLVRLAAPLGEYLLAPVPWLRTWLESGAVAAAPGARTP